METVEIMLQKYLESTDLNAKDYFRDYVLNYLKENYKPGRDQTPLVLIPWALRKHHQEINVLWNGDAETFSAHHKRVLHYIKFSEYIRTALGSRFILVNHPKYKKEIKELKRIIKYNN